MSASAPQDDGSSLSGRLARYARVSATMGRFVSRLAGERYLGTRHEPGELARELKGALGRLRGPVVKVAQLLATVPGALPSEYVAELIELQSQAPPMGWTFVKRRMASELGPDWQSQFTHLERTAAAAASSAKSTALAGSTGDCSPASCNIPGWRMRSRPISGNWTSRCGSFSITSAR